MVFAALSRMLMQINSCLNPFIYASTIPAFKKVVKSYLVCKFDAKMEEPDEIRTHSFGHSFGRNTLLRIINANNAKVSTIPS